VQCESCDSWMVEVTKIEDTGRVREFRCPQCNSSIRTELSVVKVEGETKKGD
jgi:transposase-like protein